MLPKSRKKLGLSRERQTRIGRTHKFPERAQLLQRLLSRGRVQTHGRGAQHKLCEGSGLPFAWAEAGRKQHRKDRRARVRRLVLSACPPHRRSQRQQWSCIRAPLKTVMRCDAKCFQDKLGIQRAKNTSRKWKGWIGKKPECGNHPRW